MNDTRMIYVIGAPGTGKSTMIEQFVLANGEWGQEKKWCREAWYHEFTHAELGPAWMLGRLAENSRGGFPGTDALGKAASRYTREWMEGGGQMPALVVGEGERLAYERFLLAAHNYTNLTVLHLETQASVRSQRLSGRDGTDDRMKGALPKRMANLADTLELIYGVHVVRDNTSGRSPQEMGQLLQSLI